MKPPRPLTDDELKSYAEEHLQYEVDMLIWSAGILSGLAPHKVEGFLPWAINNGLLNTFATHARNLIDFIYPPSPGRVFPTDVVLTDYLGAEAVAQHLPPISPLLKETIRKANKQVSHLTRERIDFDKGGKEWRFIAVADQIVKALAAVAPHIPASKISEQLRAKLGQPRLAIPLVNVSSINAPEGSPIGVSFSLQKNPSYPVKPTGLGLTTR